MKYVKPVTKKIPFTRAAYEDMQQNLQRLLIERKAVMGRLQVARDMGDLSENGAYHYAKFELGSIGRQLRELHHLIDNGEIVEKNDKSAVIEFGSQVTLKLGAKSIQYLLVSLHESNPAQGKLSFESPLGQALLGKKVGDLVSVSAPAGVIKYQIADVA